MRKRVPQVERLPRAVVVRVTQAERRLEGRAAAYQVGGGKLPESLTREQPGLDDLGEPFAALFLGQSLEERRVDHRPDRPVEGADEVLALGEVDRGLAADRRIDLADAPRSHCDPR